MKVKINGKHVLISFKNCTKLLMTFQADTHNLPKVNDSNDLVDPERGFHTNTSEGLWNGNKK